MLGDTVVGARDGRNVGNALGDMVSPDLLGSTDGVREGQTLGAAVDGIALGNTVDAVGEYDGAQLGRHVGWVLGDEVVGILLGELEGDCDG